MQKFVYKRKRTMNIIALDIDDCILPTNNNYFGITDDAEIIFEVNLIRLVMIIKKYNMKVFIISSWYASLSLDSGTLSLKYHRENKRMVRQFNLMNKYIGKDVMGLSCGNRVKDIEKLSKDNKVIILDDMDLSECENDNCVFIEVKGFISGNVGYKIKNFFN